jgi:hypothetical protein
MAQYKEPTWYSTSNLDVWMWGAADIYTCIHLHGMHLTD